MEDDLKRLKDVQWIIEVGSGGEAGYQEDRFLKSLNP